MATKMGRKKRLRKHIGSLAIAGVVAMMLAFVFAASVNVRIQNANKQERISQLKAQIEAENQRKEELEEYSKYVQTKKYAEEVAKDRLGLVYEDEIIFKAQD